MIVGKAVPRVDAYDKVTGRAKYVDDYFHSDFLVAKVLHSTIANGLVKKIDTSAAEKIPGVVKIVTCFDVPDICFVVYRGGTSGYCRPQAAQQKSTVLRR